MNKAVIYARVSSKDQEVEGFSIPAQLKSLYEYAAKNNLEVAQEFTDIETAKKAGRTQFSKMVKFLQENNHIKRLLVEKTDRLLRNITDYAIIDRLIDTTDVIIHLIKENVILDKHSRSNDKFIFGIKALMAKNYVDNLSEEVRKGMTEKARQGIYPSGAPYGYLNVREHGKSIIKTDPQAALFIKRIFQLYETESYSLLTLRKKLLSEGMVYRNGKTSYKSKLEAILKNEFYTGVFSWQGKRYDHASHESLISRETFERVQQILTNPHKSKSKKGLFPYTNLITCGTCGCSLTAEIKKNKYIYYRCTRARGECQEPYMRQEEIEQQFESILGTLHVSDDLQALILQGLRDSLQDKIEYHNNLVKQLERQMGVLQNRIDQTYLDKLDRKISEEYWQNNTKRWLSEKEEIASRLVALQKADTHYLENASLILELSRKAVQLFKRQNTENKRRLISLIVSNSTCSAKKLDVVLKPAFQMVMETVKTEKWCARQDLNLWPTD